MRIGRFQSQQSVSKKAQLLCLSAAMAVSVFCSFQPALAAQDPKDPPPKADAVDSLRSILQEAVEQGLLETNEAPSAPQTQPLNAPKPMKATGRRSVPAPRAAKQCEAAKQADITAYIEVTKFEDLTAAKASLTESGDISEQIRTVILSYLALGLGTEALELSERRGETLLALLSRIVEGGISEADLAAIKPYSGCHDSFRIWELTAELSRLSTSVPEIVITPEDYLALEEFPPNLKTSIGILFAIHSARSGDILAAKDFMLKLDPNTKYGALPERKDEDLLFLYALILKHKDDARFTQIFSHIAARTGRYKTLALKALADDAAESGRALPAEFESDLSAINVQYGDSHEAKTAALELVKFRLGQNQYQDAINTAKNQFGETEPMRLESTSLIGNKLLAEFASELNNRRLYALNGYFYDPRFFDTHPDVFELTRKAHDTAAALYLPELAKQLHPALLRFSDLSQQADVNESLQLAKAQLSYKAADYAQVVTLLADIKNNEAANKLRKNAALASGDRDLAQTVLASLPATSQRDTDYLAFTLQKGLWAESKMQAKTISAKDKLTKAPSADTDAAQAALPYAFSLDFLNYLTAPPAADTLSAKLPKTSEELDALLLTLKSNTDVAKGFLNYDNYSP